MPSEDLRLDLVPLHLKGLARGLHGRPGIVVAATVAQAMEFLLDNWVPSGRSEPDLTLRACRASRRPRHARIRELEAALLRKQDEPADDLFETLPHRRRARLRPRFVWSQEDFEESFDAVSVGRRTAYLPSANGEPERFRFAAVVARFQDVGGHRVPRWDVLTFGVRERGEPMASGFHEGRWFHCPLARLDARVIEAFDERGRLVSVAEGDLTASESQEARFLLRVPRGAPPADPQRVGPVPEALRGLPGALLSDSRNPVRIPEGLPLITSPAEVWAVLLRTTSGIFLPDAAPCAPPRSFRRLAGAWVVGGVPAGRVP